MRSVVLILLALLSFVPAMARAQLIAVCPVEGSVWILDRPEGTYLAVRSSAPGAGYGYDFRFENIAIAGSSISVDAVPYRVAAYGFIPVPVNYVLLGLLPPGNYSIVIRPSIASGACPTIMRTHSVAGVAYQYVPVPLLGNFASWLLAALMLLAASPVLRHRLARD